MPSPPSSIEGSNHDQKVIVDSTVYPAEAVPVRERANRNIATTRGGFFHWFDPNDGPVERRLVLKLDFYILTYACVGFWVSDYN